MKKMLFIFLLVFGLVLGACGQVKLYTDQLIADSASFNGTSWVNEFSTDGTLGGNSDRAVPTEKAVKTYVGASSDTAGIGARINLKVNLGDSSAVAKLHSYATGKMLSLKAPQTAVDTLTGDGEIAYKLGLKLNKTDTTAFLTLTDTTYNKVANQWDIDNCEATDSLHNHANEGILDDITAAYTTANATRLGALDDTIVVVIYVTDDTTAAAEVRSGYIFPIGRELTGANLKKVEVFSPDNGGGTVSLVIRRKRAAAEVVVTSDGDVDGLCTIDGTYDDVVTSDFYDFGYAEAGTADFTIGLFAYLTFVRP